MSNIDIPVSNQVRCSIINNIMITEKPEKPVKIYLPITKRTVFVTSLEINDQDEGLLNMVYDIILDSSDEVLTQTTLDDIEKEVGDVIINSLENAVTEIGV